MSTTEVTETVINDKDTIEDHDKITQLTSNWKLIGIITAFINRGLISKSDLNANIVVKDKKPILLNNIGDPTILNVANVDIYGINLFRQIHQSIDLDLQYLQSTNKPQPEPTGTISDQNRRLVDNLLIGLTTLNEHTINFISFSCENIYDPKVKKVIEYFIHQREYYLLIGRTKLKFG